MIEEINEPYRMRGHRVPSFTRTEIEFISERVCQVLKLSKKSFSRQTIGKTINRLEEKGGVDIDVIDNDEWLDCTKATVDPQAAMIYMPEKLYDELMRARPEAVRIFLHELGHVFLCHKPLLHFSDAMPKEIEDSEWQADTFADSVIQLLRIQTLEDPQLEIKFS
jgi:hypothetical protein